MAGSRQMKCEYGKISLLKNNPNVMSDAARMRLDDSIRNRPYMLSARGVVLWRVPAELPKKPDGKPSLFEKQEGKLIAIGGNQRIKALLDQGYESIPSKWVTLAKKDDGSWWTPEEAEDFVVIDNSPEGMSGENDYDMLMRHYTETTLAAAGIDLANLPLENQLAFTENGGGGGTDDGGDDGSDDSRSVEDEVETSPHGERDPELEEWIAKRERVRKDLPEMMETGFYLCLVFETHSQKMEFIEKAGLSDAVSYEMCADGIRFAKDGLGIEIDRSGLHFPKMRRDQNLAELALENDQEPAKATVSDVRKQTEADLAEQNACLKWLEKAEKRGDVPKPIADRLSVYWDWLEGEKERSEAMLEACDAAEKEGVETEADLGRMDEAKKKAEAVSSDGTGADPAVEAAFLGALKERASVENGSSDVYDADEDEDGEEGGDE